MANLGALPLLVGMGDPWISGLLCVVGSGHWSGAGTLNVMHSGVLMCRALAGFLPLAVVGAGGQIEASGAGGPFVYLWWWGSCFGLSVWSGGYWGILAGLAFTLSGTD